MSKTFVKNSVINENFAEVSKHSTYLSKSREMSRSYQINPGFGGGTSSSSFRHNHNHQDNSTAQLFDEEDEPKSKLYRYLGIAFLLVLVLLSITFLSFSIFYEEIFDGDNETAEEYWKRIQKEIQILQQKTRIDSYNRTLETALEANETLATTLLSSMESSTMSANVDQPMKPSITLQDFLYREFYPKSFNGKWISSNELLHYDNQNNLCITNVMQMSKAVVIPSSTIQRYYLSGLSLSPDRQHFLAVYNYQSLYRHTSFAEYKIFSLTDSTLSDPLTPPEYPRETQIRYAEWGPTGSQLIFVAKNDIYYKADTNSVPIRLTKTGRETLIFNGIPDWVYEEEIINGPKTFWLSPNGSNLVYATINDTSVDLMTWPYYGIKKESNGLFNQYPKIQSVRYPKPGRSNPTVSLHYIDLSKIRHVNGSQGLALNVDELTIDLRPDSQITSLGDYYFTTFTWIDNEWMAINWMTRAQNFSVITLYSNTNNFQPIPNFRLELNNGWIDLFTAPLITPDRSSYLLRVPKMSDNKKEIFYHMTRVSVTSAKSQFLTSGVFEVKKILDINTQTQRIYFIATFPGTPGSRHLLSVPLNQTESVKPICHTCLINKLDKTRSCLVSDALFSTDAHYYILECKGPSIPRIEIRRTIDDVLIYILEDNEELQYKLEGLSLPKRLFIKVPVGKYDIDVMLLVPEDFTENSTKKYPIIFQVYGGPGSDTGSVDLNYFYNRYSAVIPSNKSVIYAFLDARGSPDHGCQFMFEIYRKLGSVEVEDVLDVVKYLKSNMSYIDGNAVGIWGWSYGGYLTTKALESDRHNTIFNCGAAVAPVTDWLYYDSVYVERYMGFPTPDDNLKNYLSSSTLDKVKYLRGKEFLVMFGTADDNVHPMNSMMLLKAMNEENIKYQTQIYPDNNHAIGRSHEHVYQRLTDFFDKCFEHKSNKV